MDSITTSLSNLSLEEIQDNHIDHVRRLEQSYRVLAVKYTKVQEDKIRLRSDNEIYKRLIARNLFENRKLKREIYYLKKLID